MDASYASPPPVLSDLPREVLAPVLEDSASAYRYSTVAGIYAFPKPTPHLLRYEGRDGVVLVNASTFLAIGPGLSLFLSTEVLQATAFEYRVKYYVSDGLARIANVTISYDFRDDGPPKITAELRQSTDLPISLAWVSFTVDPAVLGNTTTLDFSSLSPPAQLASARYEAIVGGPGLDASRWTRWVALNWSDAKAGTAFAGRYSIGSLEGAAVVVVFPVGMALVDPTLVGTSSVPRATDFTIQRKAFVYAGRSWAFWHDGSNIAYASFSYANTQGTLAWSAKMTAPSGNWPPGSETGFDVDQRDGTVLVGYVPTDKLSLRVLKGTIMGSFITWSGPLLVDSWLDAEAGPPTVAVGTDGYLWAAIARRAAPSDTRPYVFRSDGPGTTQFVASRLRPSDPNLPDDSLPAAPLNAVVRILALPNGNAALLVTANGNPATMSNPELRIYRYTASGWIAPSLPDFQYLDFNAGDDRKAVMSAVAHPDGTLRVVHRASDGHLVTQRYAIDAVRMSAAILDGTRLIDYPTVSVDANGESHVLYRFKDGPDYRIYYVRQRPSWAGSPPDNSWTVPEEIFTSSTWSRRSLTAFPSALGLVGVVWTEEGPITSYVRFGGVPLPLDFGSQTGAPWNRQGLSPFQSYFRNLNEFVSPGSGLLTVKQTDLTLPGRGLDLEISRVFVTPRAFEVASGKPAASLFEDHTVANLGKGWRLNFPWLSEQYLHLWDGQMYVIRWQGDNFENHEGEHFVLARTVGTYTLYARNGIRYEFDAGRRLVAIKDPADNTIAFCYSPTCGSGSRIDNIRDATGRTVAFAYNLDGTLKSVTSGPQTISFRYATVTVPSETAFVLTAVTDALGRETRFEYDAQNPYLLKAITYPTGGKTVYAWSNPAIPIGDDFKAYYVTVQDTQNSQGQSVRANQFFHTVVNGRVSYANVVASDAGVQKGCTVFNFDALGRRSITSRRAAPCDQPGTGAQLDKQVSWFGSGGSVERVDVYAGASASPSNSLSFAYDDWGNLIYSRTPLDKDPSGAAKYHERFASFANTRYQGGYFAPGRLDPKQTGLVFFDDFEDRDLDWTVSLGDGDVTLDDGTFESLPPAMKVYHGPSTNSVTKATKTFDPQSGNLVVEAVLRAEEANRWHFFLLETSLGVARVKVALRENRQISTLSGTWKDVMPYQAGQWYRIAVEADVANSRYDLWVNGVELLVGIEMLGSGGSIERVSVQSSCTGPTCNGIAGMATTFVDIVKIHRGGTLTIDGLQGGAIVAYEDAYGRTARRARVPSLSTGVTLQLNPGDFPYGTIRIYDEKWNLEFSSPTHEFWGGDAWTYTRPWRTMALTPKQSGFLPTATTLLDDDGNKPAATYDPGEDGWDWGPWDYSLVGDFPVLGSQAHRSKYRTGMHQHYFRKVASPWPVATDQYHFQYLFIPENEYPAEIMLQFCDAADPECQPGSWRRAYWGEDVIQWAPRAWIGDLPSSSGRWLMLIVEASTLGTAFSIGGLGFTLYGSSAAWDYSGLGPAETGKIGFEGLSPGSTVELYDAKPPHLRYGPSTPAAGGRSWLTLYPGISAFPFEGYFVVKNVGGTVVYRSPVLSLWGGDIYCFNSPGCPGESGFYANAGIGFIADVGPVVHDRLVASLEFQTPRGASPLTQADRQETHIEYDARGLPLRVKVLDSTEWREAKYTYDEAAYAYNVVAGLPTTVKDPLGNAVRLSYSPTYSGAYVTQIADALGNKQRFTYDPETGRLLSEMGPYSDTESVPSKYRTRYRYDPLGRLVNESRFDRPNPSELLYFDMEWTTEAATPQLEDLSGRANHGTRTGTSIASGKVGSARTFNGASDTIQAPFPSQLGGDVSWTITFWMKWQPQPSRQWILTIGDPTTPFTYKSVHFLINTNGDAQFGFWDGVQNQFSVSASQGVYAHYATTYDAPSKTLRSYINGVQIDSDAVTGTPLLAAGKISIGKDESGVESYFEGELDELRIFTGAFSADGIDSLRHGSYGRLSSLEIAYDDVGNAVTLYEPTTKLRLLHFDMETTLNGKIEDLSGHGNHGTITGTVSATGKHGLALQFRGDSFTNNDMVEARDLDLRLPFTIAAWVNRDPTQADALGDVIEKDTNFQLKVGSDGHVEGTYHDGVAWRVVSTAAGAVPASTWTHVVATYMANGANTDITIYVNGAVSKARTTSTGQPTLSDFSVTMGRHHAALTEDFKGGIDEVHFFDRALTDLEIWALSQGKEKGFYEKQYSDSLGRVTRTVRRDLFGSLITWESYGYNFRDQVIRRTVPRDAATSFTTAYDYDLLGRPTKVTSPGSANPRTVTYDDVNRIRTVVAENLRKVQYLYDLAGRMTAVREYYDPSNYYTASNAYDEVGNLKQVSNALNQVTAHDYDNLNRLTKTTYPDGKYEAYTYDEVGNLKTRQDRALSVTTYVYDALYRLKTIDYPGTTDDVSYDYDPSGNPTSIVNPSAAVAYAYDGMGRVVSETTTVAGTAYQVGYLYDAAGRVTKLTYPDTTYLTYIYDGLGRTQQVKGVRLPQNVLAGFGYYADDRVKDITFGVFLSQSFTQSYVYSGRGWPTSIQTKDTMGGVYLDLPYTYDDSGNVLTMGSASFTYDKLDRLTTAVGLFDPRSYTAYSYDAMGNRKKLDDVVVLRPDGPGSSTQWTKSGTGGANWDRVDEGGVAPTDPSDGESTYVFAESIGAVDRYALHPLTDTRPILSVTVTAMAGGFPTSCRKSPCSRASMALQVKVGASSFDSPILLVSSADVASPAQISYTWTTNPATNAPWTRDEVSALEAGIVMKGGGEVDVTQLYVTVEFGSATYAHKDSVLGMNELTSMIRNGATTTFDYETSGTGNLKKKIGSSSWEYQWNVENLMMVALENGVRKQAYLYDGLGRRVKVEGSDSTTWTISIFSGQDVIYETHSDGGWTKYVVANGMRIARVDFDPAVGWPAPRYYLSDALGSTRQLRDASRNLVFSAEYDPFGKPYNVQGSESYKFTGEKHDDPTELVYLRARQYDPDLGRFVSLDPVLGVPSIPQTLNRYTYVVNNPLKYTDPTGEIAPLIALAIILLAAGGTGVGVGVASHYVPEIRPYTDPIADAIGLVPLVGDAFDLGYYGAQGGLDCAAGRCDPAGMAINLGGSVPVAGDILKGVKYANMGIGVFALVTKAGRRADDVADFQRLYRGFRSTFDGKAVLIKADDFIHIGKGRHISSTIQGLGLKNVDELMGVLDAAIRTGRRVDPTTAGRYVKTFAVRSDQYPGLTIVLKQSAPWMPIYRLRTFYV